MKKPRMRSWNFWSQDLSSVLDFAANQSKSIKFLNAAARGNDLHNWKKMSLLSPSQLM